MIRENENSQENYLSDVFKITKSEIIYQIEKEMVLNPIDILTNRTRMLFENYEETIKVLPKIIDIYGDYYNWDVKLKKKKYEICLKIIVKLGFNPNYYN